jgi:hypothetical protein
MRPSEQAAQTALPNGIEKIERRLAALACGGASFERDSEVSGLDGAP